MKDTIQQALNRIRTALEEHGGDISLEKIDKKEKTVYVQLHGSCALCPLSEVSLKNFIEVEIKKSCPNIRRVVAVTSHTSLHI